jgi:hypothetical protein
MRFQVRVRKKVRYHGEIGSGNVGKYLPTLAYIFITKVAHLMQLTLKHI